MVLHLSISVFLEQLVTPKGSSMIKADRNRFTKNSGMLLAMNAAKILFPLITLPYLTRVLSTDAYGTVVYVKSVISYMQLMVDFGFLLSATKEIVNANGDTVLQSKIVSNVLASKLILAGASFIVLAVFTFVLPILRRQPVYALLSFLPVFLSIFLFDFLFRGLEKMEVITLRFVIMRGITTMLTFFFIHSDVDLLKIPLLDTVGSLAAIVMIARQLKAQNIQLCKPKRAEVSRELKSSSVYFLSSIASTSLNALNTLVMGLLLTTTEIAYWGVCMQAVAAVQAVYTPISDSLYPIMIKKRQMKLVCTIAACALPVITCTCVAAYFLSDFGIVLIGGAEYLPAAATFRLLIPVLFFSFFALLFGWPALGAIDRNLLVSKTTVLSVMFDVVGMVILIALHCYTLRNVTILRSCTEVVLWLSRFLSFLRCRAEFVDYKEKCP